MSTLQRWWARLAAVGTGIGLALAVPALAWAGGSPGALAVAEEVARRRPRVGFFGGLGALCCLAVVVIIVLGLVLATRRRRR
jgi:hypothetical protein